MWIRDFREGKRNGWMNGKIAMPYPAGHAAIRINPRRAWEIRGYLYAVAIFCNCIQNLIQIETRNLWG